MNDSLNIGGDDIAHGSCHERVARELGHRSEPELTRKLASEVGAERVTNSVGHADEQ